MPIARAPAPDDVVSYLVRFVVYESGQEIDGSNCLIISWAPNPGGNAGGINVFLEGAGIYFATVTAKPGWVIENITCSKYPSINLFSIFKENDNDTIKFMLDGAPYVESTFEFQINVTQFPAYLDRAGLVEFWSKFKAELAKKKDKTSGDLNVDPP